MSTALVVMMIPTLILSASWYGPGFDGQLAANGEIFCQNELTAAHRNLPFGSILLLEHDNKHTTVRITDRGPYCPAGVDEGELLPHPTRQLDLSKAAFAELADLSEGVIDVRVSILRIGEYGNVRGRVQK